MAEDVPGQPIVETDGSRDEDPDARVGTAGAVAFAQAAPWVLNGSA